MASKRNITYACSECGRNVGRGNLRAKIIQFRDIGSRGTVVRSSVVGWLCIIPAVDGSLSCLDKDPTWNSPKYSNAPGMKDTQRGTASAT